MKYHEYSVSLWNIDTRRFEHLTTICGRWLLRPVIRQLYSYGWSDATVLVKRIY